MELSESFNKSLKAFIINDTGADVVEIIDFEEDTKGSGGCETCYFEWTEVSVTYRDSDGDVNRYDYHGDFMELVQSLLKFKA